MTTVLLVEDNPEAAQVIARAIRTAGFEVFLAYNGQQAMTVARAIKWSFEVMVVDYHLPDVKGDDLAAWVRRSISTRIPIICLTGMDLEEDGTFDRLLFKPISMLELIRAIREVMT